MSAPSSASPSGLSSSGVQSFEVPTLPSQFRSRSSHYTIVGALILWGVLVSCGMVSLVRYGATAGTAGPELAELPADIAITRDHKSTLFLFVHPRCPCSRASVSELSRMMAHCQADLRAYVYVWQAADWHDDQVRTDIWQAASSIPGVSVRVDPAGRLARRLGAETSGHGVMYDSHGSILYSGGITGARGHAGDNAGQRAVISLARNPQTKTSVCRKCSVYGCPLNSTSKAM